MEKPSSGKSSSGSGKDSGATGKGKGPRPRSRTDASKRIERVALFVDGINLWYAQQKLNYRIDYVKLRNYWVREGNRRIYNAFFYTGHHAQPEEEKQQFLDMLVNNGYTLRTKTVKTMYDPVLKKDVYKCNLDVEIVLDMVTTADLFDIAVLISGDGDFERAVEVLRVKGKQIFASCCRAMTARQLLTAVDRFYWLEEMKADLEYRGGGPYPGRTERYEEALFSDVKL